jgi:hypothetical protein
MTLLFTGKPAPAEKRTVSRMTLLFAGKSAPA